MRTVYLGTSDFAATVLRRLASSPHRPALVVTRPARPKGRGKKLTDPPVAVVARELGLTLSQPENVNDEPAVAEIRAHDAEAICVCAYGAIVKEPLLSLAPMFNVHPSLLPRWRGAAPVERAIAAGDARTGVSIMALALELDAGPVCAVAEEPIAADDDYGTLAARLAELGGDLLVATLDAAAEAQWAEQQPTTENPVTYAEKITRDDRVLQPRESTARELADMVRALSPHIGALLETADGTPLRVDLAKAIDGSLAPATVQADGEQLLIGTKSGVLQVLRVRPAGGKSMDVASFLRGNPLPELNN